MPLNDPAPRDARSSPSPASRRRRAVAALRRRRLRAGGGGVVAAVRGVIFVPGMGGAAPAARRRAEPHGARALRSRESGGTRSASTCRRRLPPERRALAFPAPERAAVTASRALSPCARSACTRSASRAQPGDSTVPERRVQPMLARIAECESGGDPTAVSARGTYRGKYQFNVATWRTWAGGGPRRGLRGRAGRPPAGPTPSAAPPLAACGEGVALRRRAAGASAALRLVAHPDHPAGTPPPTAFAGTSLVTTEASR